MIFRKNKRRIEELGRKNMELEYILNRVSKQVKKPKKLYNVNDLVKDKLDWERITGFTVKTVIRCYFDQERFIWEYILIDDNNNTFTRNEAHLLQVPIIKIM